MRSIDAKTTTGGLPPCKGLLAVFLRVKKSLWSAPRGSSTQPNAARARPGPIAASVSLCALWPCAPRPRGPWQCRQCAPRTGEREARGVKAAGKEFLRERQQRRLGPRLRPQCRRPGERKQSACVNPRQRWTAWARLGWGWSKLNCKGPSCAPRPGPPGTAAWPVPSLFNPTLCVPSHSLSLAHASPFLCSHLFFPYPK